MEDFPRDQDYELAVLLTQARETMYKARKIELSEYGLSPRQSAALFMIQALGNRATTANIARYLLREPHSVSMILSRMEKDGLLKKVKNQKKNKQKN